MATELARRIRGTRTGLGQEVRKSWIEAQDSWCEPLTFGDLEVGDNFIVMPEPGDNSGHGGLLNDSHLLTKIKPYCKYCYYSGCCHWDNMSGIPYKINCMRVLTDPNHRFPSHISDKTFIFKIS